MPQIQLPVFPAGSTEINSGLAFECRDNQVTYFNGHLPVFTHAAHDLASFRFFTTQLIINGSASQSEIVQAFGVSLTTVKRYTRKYRREGGKAFFAPPRRRSGSRLTPECLAQAQRLLDEGLEVPELSRRLGVLATTLHKAIQSGRLQIRKKKILRPSPPSGPAPRPSGS
jgi:DNA invertase Pin-like site-specific DNA recombinase